MRPLFFGVTLEPPEMTICFPGRPLLFATVRIKARVSTKHEAELAAVREMDAMTAEQLELVREIAKPEERAALVATEAPVLAGMIQRVYMEPRPTGPVHCPGCGMRLGKADSPSIGYVRQCHGCRGSIDIQFHEGSVVVTFQREQL